MTNRREFLKTAAYVPLIGLPTFPSALAENVGGNDRSQYLRSLCEEGLRRCYADQPDKCQGGSLSQAVQERLNTELRVLTHVGLVEPLLFLSYLMSQDEKNDALASMRGAAASSLVNYALGLSQVCPLKHRLLFERFIYVGRTTPFNFDIAMGFYGMMGLLLYLKQNHPGVKRQEISDSDFRITVDGIPGISQFDLQFSGLDTLEVQRGILHSIDWAHQTTVDPESWPEDDPNTFSLLQRGDTDSVFQLVDSGIKDYLQRLKPTNLGELIAAIVLYRPRPIENGLADAYVNRKHGHETVTYLHPIQEEILGETYGLILYQEQVMQLLYRVGGIDLAEGYGVIKAFSKKKTTVIEDRRRQFMDEARRRGFSRDVAEHTFWCIYFFGGYGYCKAHAAAHAQIIFQAAYLKAHYPEALASYKAEYPEVFSAMVADQAKGWSNQR